MNTNTSASTLTRYHTNWNGPCSHGPFQPPRNRVTAIEQITRTFMYSPRKKNAHFMLEYSVWNPATNSASASGRSKGARLVSAKAVIMKVRKAIGWVNTNQPG